MAQKLSAGLELVRQQGQRDGRKSADEGKAELKRKLSRYFERKEPDEIKRELDFSHDRIPVKDENLREYIRGYLSADPRHNSRLFASVARECVLDRIAELDRAAAGVTMTGQRDREIRHSKSKLTDAYWEVNGGRATATLSDIGEAIRNVSKAEESDRKYGTQKKIAIAVGVGLGILATAAVLLL